MFWRCDAAEAIIAKATDIKMQLHSALEQFSSSQNIVVHFSMETFDGPEVEMKKLMKITDTLENIDLSTNNLKCVYCHFFQSYSTPDEAWIFVETVNTISSVRPDGFPPLNSNFLIVPAKVVLENRAHWERPLP